MARAVRQLDAETIYTRLFSHRKELTEAGLDRIMHVDDNEVVLVATTGNIALSGNQTIDGVAVPHPLPERVHRFGEKASGTSSQCRS